MTVSHVQQLSHTHSWATQQMKEAGVYHPNDPQNILKLMIFVSCMACARCGGVRRALYSNNTQRGEFFGGMFFVHFKYPISTQ